MTPPRIASFVFVLTLAATLAQAASVELAKTPAAVQATVKTLLGANKMEDLLVEDDAYVVEWYDAKEDGHFATIQQDGKVTQTEDDVKTASLPAAGLAAIKAKRPTATLPTTATKMTVDGKVTYSVDVTVGTKSITLIIDPAGKLVADLADDEDVANLGATTKPTK